MVLAESVMANDLMLLHCKQSPGNMQSLSGQSAGQTCETNPLTTNILKCYHKADVCLAISQDQRRLPHHPLRHENFFCLFSVYERQEGIHRQPVLDILILVLFTFHSIYGLRTIAIDLGYRKEKQLFWLSNLVATIISVILILLYAQVV
jgi:hypothetical protein